MRFFAREKTIEKYVDINPRGVIHRGYDRSEILPFGPLTGHMSDRG